MSTLEQHPTVRRFRQELRTVPPLGVLDAAELKAIARAAGADDVGLVRLARTELDDQRADILRAFPHAKSLISIIGKMNREPIRTPTRSISNLEFHETTDHLNVVARTIVRELQDRGFAALNPAVGFPMEMSKFPGKAWVVSHKPVAVAAGLGRMGIHRNVIHPQFGNFILLDTILLAHDISEEDRPIDYNPCLSCKLCVAACPVGAISPDGAFNFNACMTHNYREFMSGFTDWVATVADSRDGQEYRRRVSESESASMWQSLAFGPNYKAAYCLSVCPAGDEVIAPFLHDRGQFMNDTLKPLQAKEETLYVVPGSDAVEYATRKYPHKPLQYVNGIRPTSIAGFLFGLPLVFQPGASAGLDATYHFTFTGRESATATVVIRDQTVSVTKGEHVGKADLHVIADSATWLRFLAKDANIVWAIVRRKVRVKGPIRLLKAFGNCFPS
jgi:ferredoxin